MVARSDTSLIEKKALTHVLSYLYCEDVEIIYPADDQGIDLIVEIPKGNRRLGWNLGVEVKGFLDMPTGAKLNRALESKAHAKVDDLIFPLVFCVVEARRSRGIYTWILEPVVEMGRPQLRQPAEYAWNAIDEAAVHGMYQKTARYWEALIQRVRE